MIVTAISPISCQALRPPMPVELMGQLNEQDVAALWAYLGSLK